MSNNDLEEYDPLEEHRIANSVKKDYESVLNSKQLSDFKKGLQYKSEKTKQTDLAAFDLLISRLKAYSNGWIMANMCQTSNLWDKSLTFDNQVKEFKENSKIILNDINGILNALIVQLKPIIDKDKLDSLRKSEIEFRELIEKI